MSTLTIRTTLITVVILMALFLPSCDPTHPILISNKKTDTVTVVIETTIRFHSNEKLIGYEELGRSYNHKIVKFKVGPSVSLKCGMAIAGMEDEMPFTKFKVYSKNDSIIANSQNQILDMFKKTPFGNLETPYQLIIN